ncbi:MAG: DUF1330 domain-containing protein [Pseudomonadota bacterium]
MPGYLIVEVTVTDDSWIPAYTAEVHKIAQRHGGRYLTRTNNIEVIEGEDQGLSAIVLIEFPSVEAAKAFHADPDYAPLMAMRKGGATSRFTIVDAADLAGVVLDPPAPG